MKITASMYQTQYSKNPHPVLTVDGASLDVWLSKEISEVNVLNLVPAQGWLIDEDDLALAWRRIRIYEENCSTIVPLLICPDDLDLSCTVVVVDQETSEQQITWHKFGFSFHSGRDQVGSSVKWFKDSPSATFGVDQFNTAIAELERLTNEVWR